MKIPLAKQRRQADKVTTRSSQIKSQKSKKQNQKTLLLAVSGMSPAIITETVWALAQEEPAIIPDEVIVVTTARGRADLDRDLFSLLPEWNGQMVWQALRQTLLPTPDDPRLEFKPCRVITVNDPTTGRSRELDDIRTKEENAAAAEVILEEVRRLTANDDTRVIASIAGGRKTMGALLHAAMSLLGRRQDRLTHVLVNEPFDHPGLAPKFFFPGQPGTRHELRLPDGTCRVVPASQARPEIADVPFPALHYLFRKHLGRLPGGFASLVRTAAGLVEELVDPVNIETDFKKDYRKATVSFDGVPVDLSGRDIPFFYFLLERAQSGQPPFASHFDAYDDFLDYLDKWMPDHPVVNLQFGNSDWRNAAQQPKVDQLRKRVDSLRTRLSQADLGRIIPILFPVRGPLGFPPDMIRSASN